MAEDHYKTLGLRRNATLAEIKRAYKRLSKTVHPDVNPGDPEAGERFAALANAYEALSRSEECEKYDQSLPPESAVDLEKFESPGDAPPMPPQVNLFAVDFGSIKQGDSSIRQVILTVENPNGGRFLTPVVNSRKSAFWRTRRVSTDPHQFVVSVYEPEILASGVHGGQISVSWSAYPEVITKVPVSIIVEPVDTSAVIMPRQDYSNSSMPKSMGTSRPSSSRPTSSVRESRPTETSADANYGWVLLALANVAAPIFVMYNVIGGVTATVSGWGAYVILGPICFIWLIASVVLFPSIAAKAFKGRR